MFARLQHLVVPIFFISFFFLLSLLYYQTGKYQVATNSDISINLFFSKNFANRASLTYPVPINKDFSEKIFGAEGMFLAPNGEMTYNSFHGLIILLGLFFVYQPLSYLLLIPLMATIGYFAYYLICRHFFRQETSLILTAILAFSGPFFFWSTLLFNNIPTWSFFMLSMYFILSAVTTGDNRHLVFFTLAAAGTIWTRFPAAILYLPVGICLLFMFPKIRIKGFLIMLSISVATMIPLFIINYQLYGNFLGFLQNAPGLIYNRDLVGRMVYKTIGIIPFVSWELLLENINTYILALIPGLAILFTTGATIFIRHLKTYPLEKRWFPIMIIIVALTNILFYAGGIFSGFGSDVADVGTSYPRYMLSAYSLLFFFGGFALDNLPKNLVLLGLAALIPSGVLSAMTSPNGYLAYKGNVESRYQEKQTYLRLIPADAVVFIKDFSILLFPDRTVAHYSAIPRQNRVDTIISMISKLRVSKQIYFVADSHEDNLPAFLRSFNASGLQVDYIQDNVYQVR